MTKFNDKNIGLKLSIPYLFVGSLVVYEPIRHFNTLVDLKAFNNLP